MTMVVSAMKGREFGLALAPITFRPGSMTGAARKMARIVGTRGAAPNPWSVDTSYASTVSVMDGRVCIPNTGDPYDFAPPERGCGLDWRICGWAFLKADTPCNDETFLRVMFQGDRFIWAQQQLQAKLRSKPVEEVLVPAAARIPRERERVRLQWTSDMVDWCRDVMSFVSVARWAANVHPEWAPELNDGPAARAALSRAASSLPFQPQKAYPEDLDKIDFQNTPVMWMPRDFHVQPGVRFNVPVRKADFAPHFLGREKSLNITAPRERLRDVKYQDIVGATIPIRRGPYGVWPGEYAEAHWPAWARTGRSCPPGTRGCNPAWGSPVPMSNSRDAMRLWFRKTLGGSSTWREGHEVRGAVRTRRGCPDVIGGPGWCMKGYQNIRHAWGTANLQVAMCEAWAQDIINTTFGDYVADGFQRFILAVDDLPPHLRGLALSQIRALRDSAAARVMNETNAIVSSIVGGIGTAAAAIATASAGSGPGAIVGAIAAAVLAVVGIAVAIAGELGAFAPDREELRRSCLAPPVMRMILDSRTNACNFDPRFESSGRVRAQTAAIVQLKDDFRLWFQASSIAAGEGVTDPAGSERNPPAHESPVVLIGGLAMLGIGAYLIMTQV